MTVSPRLDEIDQRILAQLRQNARASHAKLGEMVNLSRNAVRQRIDRLERDGYIRGYTILESVHDEARVAATLLVDRVDRMRGADVIAALREIPEVVSCDVVTGELDLIVRVEATTPARIQDIWQQLSSMGGVRNTVTAVALRTIINRRTNAHTSMTSEA